VTRLFNYQLPFRAIFYDEDGSVTGKGPGSWATPYNRAHEVPECEYDEEYWGSVFCDNTIQVRRVAFTGSQPLSTFKGMQMNILLWDDDLLTMNGTWADKNNTEN
jgi:hypothetical protein